MCIDHLCDFLSGRTLLPYSSWIVTGALIFSGCSGLRSGGEAAVRQTGCDHPSGWSDQSREAAVDSWFYAQLAQNSYPGDPAFVLPETVSLDTTVSNDRTGFAASVYSVRRASDSVETVIAYRGTYFWSWRDWLFGNIGTVQNREGLRLFDSIRARLGESAPITVTGHSLGGGISFHVSLRREHAPAYVFNSSSRFTRGDGIENPRYSIAQYAEILKPLRAIARAPTGYHTVVGCTEGGPVDRHAQVYLAECLTRIAAINDESARASSALNSLPADPPLAPPCGD